VNLKAARQAAVATAICALGPPAFVGATLLLIDVGWWWAAAVLWAAPVLFAIWWSLYNFSYGGADEPWPTSTGDSVSNPPPHHGVVRPPPPPSPPPPRRVGS
jgi:hypothetical protein